MFNSKSSSNYQMPSALKKKLHYAKRTFSSNKPMYGSKENSTSSFNSTTNPYIPYTFKSNNTNTQKHGHEKLTKREEKEKRNLINQKFAEIESALQTAKNHQLAREHGNAWVTTMKNSEIDYFESELRKAHRINYIDLVLSEETTLI